MSDSLNAALARHDIELDEELIAPLQQYCEVMWEWNEKLNLTRHTDYERFATRDVKDCLELSKLLGEAELVLDVGSGGGVPGIVLAILRPDLQVALCESVQKKAAVLADMTQQLSLPITVFPERAEVCVATYGYDTLVARAVGPLWKMLKWFEPHWGSFGRLLAIKGPRWVKERGEARHRGFLKGLELRRMATYTMIGTESDSVILQIRARSDRR